MQCFQSHFSDQSALTNSHQDLHFHVEGATVGTEVGWIDVGIDVVGELDGAGVGDVDVGLDVGFDVGLDVVGAAVAIVGAEVGNAVGPSVWQRAAEKTPIATHFCPQAGQHTYPAEQAPPHVAGGDEHAPPSLGTHRQLSGQHS